MIIGALQKFSLLDYPNKISAIVFTQGCNFRCPFCYNPMLVWPDFKAGEVKYNSLPISNDEGKSRFLVLENDFFRFLKKRKDKLEGIVITGGEPTLHKDLPEFIDKIKSLGYSVKLDTNGTNPNMLEFLFKKKLLDYVAMDIKGSPKKYSQCVGVEVDFKKIEKSVKIIMSNKVPYEFRTTMLPALFKEDDVNKIGKLIKGADKWFLQKFYSDTDLVNNNFKKLETFNNKQLNKIKEKALLYVKQCEIR